jgi:hypothetical protein
MLPNFKVVLFTKTKPVYDMFQDCVRTVPPHMKDARKSCKISKIDFILKNVEPTKL